MSGGIRSQGRAYALQVLYAIDVGEADEVGEVGEAAGRVGASFDLEVPPPARAFADELVEAVSQRRAEIDETIAAASRNWRLERMSRVDRNILRLATLELKASPEVPVKVVINEAVELAKRFGAAEAAAFVNGILDRIAQRVR